MANIDLSLDDAVEATLTTGDDTLNVEIGVDGVVDANAVDGNGGTNVAVVEDVLNDDAVGGTDLTGDTLGGTLTFTAFDGTAVDTLELTDFSSIAFDNGTLTTAATATEMEYLQSDILEDDYAPGMTIGDSTTVIGWDGAAADASTNTWTVSAVNGTAVAANDVVNLTGIGAVTVNGSATGTTFTAFASYTAALGLGETASESFTITFTSDADEEFTETFTVNFTGTDNSGANVVVGTAAGDNVDLGLSSDTLWAGADDAGADIVVGGDAADVLAGGAGADQLVGDGADGTSLFDDTLNVTGTTLAAGADTIYGGDGNDIIVGGGWDDDGNDVIEVGEIITDETAGNEVWAGAGNDTVHGANGADTLGGGDGDDELYGYGGNDVIYTGNGAGGDIADGGDGNDTIYGGSFGDDDNDSITGGAGNDELYGGTGDDVLNGGTGADTLYGGAGDDVLTGGGGIDVFYFGADSGNDTVTDFDLAADRLDVSTYFSSFAEVQAAMAQVTQGGSTWTEIQLSDDATITLANINMADLTAGDFIF